MSTEGEAELPAPAGDVGGGSHSRHVDLDGSKFDLNALFNFTHLQDFLRTLAAQQRQQMQLIQGLRSDLEKANREGEVVAQKLKAEIDTKATEKALTALALETSRDKAAMQRKHENLESTMTKRFEKNEAKTEQLQSKIYDCKVELETKAAQRTVDALTTRVDACATAVELADVKTQITTRLDESDKENNERHERNEATQQMNTKRIVAIEQMAKGLCTKKELEEVEGALKEKDQALLEEIENVESRGVAALAETKRQTDIHFARNEEVLDQHWQHIRNAEELLRTKADREVVQQDFEKAAANLAALDKRVTEEHNTFVDSTMAWMNTTDERVGVLEKRQKSSEDLLATKASKTETEELRQAVALCSLRTEMRELLEALRQETNSRVRMLKERLDRTDRELLRQLEESQNNDRSDKFDALAAIVETKADKAMTERWLEASQQLHGELQAVHVRTQTLGQGMKVVLGWVEGMADKVQGLQGAQHRLAQQAVAQKEEQQFALNATARETIGKVKTMLASQASAMPPSSPRTNAFEGSKPRSRPTTGGGVGVVLKDEFPSQASAAVSQAAAFADEGASLDPDGRQMLLESAAFAGPAGAALAGAAPVTGVMSKQALERLADGNEPFDTSRPGTAPGMPFRTETERRKHALDTKRQELVESRMRGGAGSPAGMVSEPRPPAGPRPDTKLGFAHPIAPRRLEGLEVEGQPPPAFFEGDTPLHASGAQTAR